MSSPSPLLPRLIDTGICAGLVVALAAVVYGHVGGGACGLSLMESYITEYMKEAPHWPWLILASFAFAVVLFLLAIACLQQGGSHFFMIVGALLLAATAMGNFFVAYAPVRRVKQPPPSAHEWWAPAWWFTSRSASTPYEDGLADAYADVHYRAIRLVVVAGVAGLFCIATACASMRGGLGFALWTWAAVVLLAVLFNLTDHVQAHRGLSQRLGFGVLYLWLCTAWLHTRSLRKFGSDAAKPR